MLISNYLKSILLIITLSIFATVANGDIIRPKAYYKVGWENIQCYVPPCPQYSVTRANSDAKPERIISMIYPKGFDQQYVQKNDSNDLIVFGNKTPNPEFPKEFDFTVTRVYKKLPLGNPCQSSDKFVLFADNGIRCIKAPCFSTDAVQLNTFTKKSVSAINSPYATNVFSFDSNWFSSKLIRSDDTGLIAQGSFNSNGEFVISNAYIYLPDPSTKCPELPLLKCQSGSIMTYERNENRCLESPTCTKSGICTLSIPVCQKGYRLDSHPSTSKGGCPQYYCDPVFVSKTH